MECECERAIYCFLICASVAYINSCSCMFCWLSPFWNTVVSSHQWEWCIGVVAKSIFSWSSSFDQQHPSSLLYIVMLVKWIQVNQHIPDLHWDLDHWILKTDQRLSFNFGSLYFGDAVLTLKREVVVIMAGCLFISFRLLRSVCAFAALSQHRMSSRTCSSGQWS